MIERKNNYSQSELDLIKQFFQIKPETHESVDGILNTLDKIGESLGKINLAEIEIILRELDSITFFVAKPLNNYPDKSTTSRLPQTGDEKEYPYYLFIIVNPDEELQRDLFDPIYAAENLLKLTYTGLLVHRKEV